MDDTLGWIYVKKGLPVLGIPLLERASAALVGHPIADTATVDLHLAQAYSQSGNKAKAKQLLDKLSTMKVDPLLAAQIQKVKDAL